MGWRTIPSLRERPSSLSADILHEFSAYQRDGDKANSVALDDGRQNQGLSGWADQRHRYTVTVPVVNGQFKLGFGSMLIKALAMRLGGLITLR